MHDKLSLIMLPWPCQGDTYPCSMYPICMRHVWSPELLQRDYMRSCLHSVLRKQVFNQMNRRTVSLRCWMQQALFRLNTSCDCLLQGRIQGYLYNIQTDSDYSERVIPPSPERPPSPTFHPPPASRWGPNPSAPTPYLTSFFSSSSSGPNAATAQNLADQWRNTAQHYFGSSSQLHPHMGPVGHPGSSSSSSSKQAAVQVQVGNPGLTTIGCSSKCRQAWQIMHSKGSSNTACNKKEYMGFRTSVLVVAVYLVLSVISQGIAYAYR